MKNREKIVPIVLAAGSSERLGIPKALAKFGEKTAIQIALENCMGYEQLIVVLGCDADQVLPEVPPTAKTLVNDRWREGQLSSLLCAFRHVPQAAAMLIYPVDHPLLTKRDIARLVNEYEQRSPNQQIVMPRYKKKYGHPIIVSGDLGDELCHATTTREVVYRIPDRLRVFEAATNAIYEDFHSPRTYQNCLRKYLARINAKG